MLARVRRPGGVDSTQREHELDKRIDCRLRPRNVIEPPRSSLDPSEDRPRQRILLGRASRLDWRRNRTWKPRSQPRQPSKLQLERHGPTRRTRQSTSETVTKPVDDVDGARRREPPQTATTEIGNLAVDEPPHRHVAWSETLEPALRGPYARRVLDELEIQRGMLDVVLDHALSAIDPTDGVRIVSSVSAWWSYRGHFEGWRWIDRALVVSDGIDDGPRVRLLVAAGSHRDALGDQAGFRRLLDEALTLARDSDSGDDAARVLLWAGHAAVVHDDHAAARDLYTEAHALAEASGDASRIASALAGLGDVVAAAGDLATATALHLRSRAEFRGADDTHGEGQALLNIAEIDRRAARTADAERIFHDARGRVQAHR